MLLKPKTAVGVVAMLLAVLLTLATVFALAIASDRAMHATIS